MKIFLMLVALLSLLSSCGMGVGFTQTHGGTNLNYQVSTHDMKFETEASAKVKGHSVFCVLPVYDALMKQAMENLNANADIKSNNKAIFNLRVDVEDKFYVFWCTRHVTVSGDVYRIIREDTSSKIGSTWSKKTLSEMDWHSAETYCKDLKEAGHSDWRLPTISELRGLIRNCPATETGGSCKVTNSCLSDSCWNDACKGCPSATSGEYSIFDHIGGLWSSAVFVTLADYAWRVDFNNGGVNSVDRKTGNYVRCVR